MKRAILVSLITSLCLQGVSQSEIDSLEQLLASIEGQDRVDVLNNLSYHYAFVSLDQSKAYADSAITEARNLHYGKGEVAALVNLGYWYYDIKKFDSARLNFEDARARGESKGHQRETANALTALGNVYNSLSDLPEALRYYKEALHLQEQIGHQAGIATAINNIGSILFLSGDYPNAMAYYLQALELNRNHGDQRRELLNLKNIVEIHIFNDEYAEALARLAEMRQIDLLSKNKRYEASYYNWLGVVNHHLEKYEIALDNFRLAEQDYSAAGYSTLEVQQNLTELYLSMGRLEEALQSANRLISAKQKIGDPNSICFAHRLKTNTLLGLGQNEAAHAEARQMYELARVHGLKDKEETALKLMSQAQLKLGSPASAYDYLAQSNVLRDSLYNAKKSLQRSLLITLFETEEQQRTIELQEARIDLSEADNERLWLGIGASLLLAVISGLALYGKYRAGIKLARQKEEIERQNREKEVLLKEIHHRVKNNLQVISSILNIQSRELTNEEARMAVKEGQGRIKSMSLIHQKLYSNENLALIDMPDYINDLSEFLFSAYKSADKVKRKIQIEDLMLDIDTAIPLGLILNELISNALKYAFRDNEEGEIEVNLSKSHDNISLVIRDSGRGLPPDYEQSKRMGMQLVTTLVDQIDGDLTTVNDNGAKFVITLKDTQAAA